MQCILRQYQPVSGLIGRVDFFQIGANVVEPRDQIDERVVGDDVANAGGVVRIAQVYATAVAAA